MILKLRNYIKRRESSYQNPINQIDLTMTAELLLCLSKDLLKLFESSAANDVSIIVGEGPNTKMFKAHSAILISRSPYFDAALSSNWVKKEDGVSIFKKP